MTTLTIEVTPRRRASVRLITDGVVAGYLHGISQRHRTSLTSNAHAGCHIPDAPIVLEAESQTDE